MADNGDGTVSVPLLGDTPFMAAVLVVAAIVLLFAIERGFRGIKIG
jgi:hypothetical protein